MKVAKDSEDIDAAVRKTMDDIAAKHREETLEGDIQISILKGPGQVRETELLATTQH